MCVFCSEILVHWWMGDDDGAQQQVAIIALWLMAHLERPLRLWVIKLMVIKSDFIEPLKARSLDCERKVGGCTMEFMVPYYLLSAESLVSECWGHYSDSSFDGVGKRAAVLIEDSCYPERIVKRPISINVTWTSDQLTIDFAFRLDSEHISVFP